MMIEPPIADLLNRASDRYTLVMMVSKRARQITAGSHSRTEHPAASKSLTKAIYEVHEGKVNFIRRKAGIK